MYDSAEIPHLFNEDDLSLEKDLQIVYEAHEYISRNNVST